MPEWKEPTHPRHRTEMAQLRALLEAWRQEGFDDAYDYVRAAEQMIVKERAWYDELVARGRHGMVRNTGNSPLTEHDFPRSTPRPAAPPPGQR